MEGDISEYLLEIMTEMDDAQAPDSDPVVAHSRSWDLAEGAQIAQDSSEKDPEGTQSRREADTREGKPSAAR